MKLELIEMLRAAFGSGGEGLRGGQVKIVDLVTTERRGNGVNARVGSGQVLGLAAMVIGDLQSARSVEGVSIVPSELLEQLGQSETYVGILPLNVLLRLTGQTELVLGVFNGPDGVNCELWPPK